MILDDHCFYGSLEALGGWSLVVFGAPGCGACRRAQALLPALSEALPGVSMHYAQADRNMGVLADLEAFHLPFLQLYDGAEAHAAIAAPLSVNALVDFIVAAMAAPPTST